MKESGFLCDFLTFPCRSYGPHWTGSGKMPSQYETCNMRSVRPGFPLGLTGLGLGLFTLFAAVRGCRTDPKRDAGS